MNKVYFVDPEACECCEIKCSQQGIVCDSRGNFFCLQHFEKEVEEKEKDLNRKEKEIKDLKQFLDEFKSSFKTTTKEK